MEFIGRTAELAALRKRLDLVTSSGRGAAVAVRGRRQVGKSRLVQEFCDRAGDHDRAALESAAPAVPGFVPGTTGLVIASRSGPAPGVNLDRIDVAWGPADVVAAWQAG